MSPRSTFRTFRVLALITAVGYALFATVTDLQSLGLSSARYPERWMVARYLVVALWLVLAWLLHRRRKAELPALDALIAGAGAGAVALMMAGSYLGGTHRPAILGTAVTYVLIAVMLSLGRKRAWSACLLAALLVPLQFVVDVVVLGVAGEFRLH